jgi:hypothetical protein
MPNVTLSIDEETLTAGREYARSHHTSLNALIRRLLHNTVSDRTRTKNWQTRFFANADAAGGKSNSQKWRREDLYDA